MTQEERIQLIREAHAQALEDKKMATCLKQAKLGEVGFAHVDELLPVTQEDVLDEAEHLDALDHEQEVDFDSDENEVDMNTLSPQMRELFS